VLDRAFPESIRVELDLGDVAPIMVDRAELDAALLNLAVNARDAMPNGGSLRFETRPALSDTPADGALRAGRYTRVRVIDSGIGIPPDVIERVFEPFFTTKPPGEGTGLGLSQVYGFASQSGGHASVASQVGEGTVITLFLPVVE
jgi:signal transduction histidine kinase